jgi:aspartate/methionine/tyrosine aminotransferase
LIANLCLKYGIESGDKRCLITAGGKEALWLAFSLLIKANTRVLLPNPGWIPYYHIAESLGGQINTYNPTYCYKNSAYFLDLLRYSSVDLLVINSPSNPEGATLSDSTLLQLVELAKINNFNIVSDEVYRRLNFPPPPSLVSFIDNDRQDNFVIIDSVSKTFGMAGLRIGNLIGGVNFVKQATLLRSAISSLVSIPSQQIALALLSSDEGIAWQHFLVGEITKARETVSKKLLNSPFKDIVDVDQKGLYIWLKGVFKDEVELNDDTRLLGKGGNGFMTDQGIRLCLGDLNEIAKLIESNY